MPDHSSTSYSPFEFYTTGAEATPQRTSSLTTFHSFPIPSTPRVLRTISVNHVHNGSQSSFRCTRSRSASQSCAASPCSSVLHTPRQVLCGNDCVTPLSPRCCPITTEALNKLAVELDVTASVRRRIRNPLIRSVTPFLCISGEEAVHSPDMLADQHVTHVANVAPRDTAWSIERMCQGLSLTYRAFNTRDDPDYPILCYHYDEFAEFIDRVRAEGGRALVHCVAGINRSVTLCIAYMVDRCGLNLIHACRLVRESGDSFILDNVGFRHQLVEFCKHRYPSALQALDI